MSYAEKKESFGGCADEGPQSAMEKALIEEYLAHKGYSLHDLGELPKEEVKALMKEACQYASLHLAHVESTAHFREKIRRAV